MIQQFKGRKKKIMVSEVVIETVFKKEVSLNDFG